MQILCSLSEFPLCIYHPLMILAWTGLYYGGCKNGGFQLQYFLHRMLPVDIFYGQSSPFCTIHPPTIYPSTYPPIRPLTYYQDEHMDFNFFLQCSLNFIYTQFCSNWSIFHHCESPSVCRVLLMHSPLLPDITRCLSLVLFSPCPGLETTSHFSEEKSCFWRLEWHGIRNQDLDSRCAHCYWGVIATRLFWWIHTHKYTYTCTVKVWA